MERKAYYNDKEADKIDLTRFKNLIHGEYMHDVLTKALDTPAIVANLPTQLAQFRLTVEAETRAGFKDVAGTLADYVNTVLDPARDKAETGLKSGFRAAMEMPNQEVAQAGETMLKLMQKHKLNTSLNTDAQTDAIRDFIADTEANYMATLRLTGMEVLFEKLREANQAVCDAMISRDEADSNKVVNAMVEARKATDAAYRDLMHGVDAQSYLNGAEPYAEFISYMNALIRRYKRVHLGQKVESPEAAPGDVVDGDHVVETPEENTPGEGAGPENGGNNSGNGNENNGVGSNTPGGSIPTNPQPGDGDDPDLFIYEL